MQVCDRGGRPARSMPTINVLTFNVFVLNIRVRHTVLLGCFSVGISSNGRIIGRIMVFGRIMIKPTDCSLSISNTSSLLEKQTSIFREGYIIVKIHKKKNELFFHLRKKAYLCSWTTIS